MLPPPPRSTLFPYTTLFRSRNAPTTCWSTASRAQWRSPPGSAAAPRSEEHTSELQSHLNLVCRLLLEKKKLESKDRITNSINCSHALLRDTDLNLTAKTAQR